MSLCGNGCGNSLVKPNNRFIYFAHFRNLTLANDQRSQMWILEPDVVYAMPNDNGITLLVIMLPKTKLAVFKRDVQGNFELPHCSRCIIQTSGI
jgi:hypothetical protein